MNKKQTPGSTEGSLFSMQASGWFRGIAAVMVVASHYAEWWSWFTPSEGNAELFRLALTKLGGYGVSLFFLFSGYGLVRSWQRQVTGKDRLSFVVRRLEKVYLPYLIVAGLLELLSGGFSSPGKLLPLLTGYDYWYMMVLFLLYIGFLLLWPLPCPKVLRVLLLSLYIFLLSWNFHRQGMQIFWYVSNSAFVLGVLAAEYEPVVQKAVKNTAPVLLLLLALGMVIAVRSGLGLDGRPPLDPQDVRLVWRRIGAETVWTLFILVLAATWKSYDRFLILLGRNSLYVYLIHTFVFMRCVNLLPWSIAARFVSSALLTILLSLLCGWIADRILGLAGARRQPSSM